MDHKLHVLLKLDLDGESARLEVRGDITMRNVVAVYSLLSRTTTLTPTPQLTVDLQHAGVEPAVLHDLLQCAGDGCLPAHLGTPRTDCSLRVLTPLAVPAAESLPGADVRASHVRRGSNGRRATAAGSSRRTGHHRFIPKSTFLPLPSGLRKMPRPPHGLRAGAVGMTAGTAATLKETA